MKRMMGLLLVVALLGAGVAVTTPVGARVRVWGVGAYQTAQCYGSCSQVQSKVR